MQPLALLLILLGGCALRQVFYGRGRDLPTDARDLVIAMGSGDWDAASEVTGRRGTASDPDSETGAGGGSGDPAAGASTGSGHAWQTAQLKARFGDKVVITSTTGGGHVAGSFHYKGQAVDIDTKSGLTKGEVFKWIAKTYPTSAELIYTPGGSSQIKDGKQVGSNSSIYASVAASHNDHIHWAWTGK